MPAVGYSKDLARGQQFRFVRLLFRWNGSFYKLIVHEFVIYFFIYLFLNVLHSFLLDNDQKMKFAEVCNQLGSMSNYVVASVTFCLGFFIQQVYKRYCDHFLLVPWPDAFAFLASVNVRGQDMRGRLLRRTMVRYAVASIVLTWMSLSERMKTIFPDLDSLVVAGFLTDNELSLMKSVAKPSGRAVLAASWCSAVVKRARMEKRIEDDFAFNALFEQLDVIRSRCLSLFAWSNRPPPLAYFHIVIIGVYSFFSIAAVAGGHRYQTQQLHKDLTSEGGISNDSPVDIWELRLLSLVITLLQFSICAGVLAISRSLVQPFGMDDSNINAEEIVRRHLTLAYLIVDELHSLIPEIKQEEMSIFQIGSFKTMFHSTSAASLVLVRTKRKKRNSRIKSIIPQDDRPNRKPSYKMSVAPRHQPIVPSDGEEQEKSKTERSHADIRRLLSFRRIN